MYEKSQPMPRMLLPLGKHNGLNICCM